MRKTARILGLALALALPCPLVGAQDKAKDGPDCAALTEWLGAMRGYDLTVPAAAPKDGWCILDGATLRSTTPGLPNLHAHGLRLGAAPGGIVLELTGLRVSPKVGDAQIDDRLRSLFRLQTADLSLTAIEDVEAGVLRLEAVTVRLSGGTEIGLEAEIAGAGLAPASLAGGKVTRLALDWRNDGRLLRQVMEMAGHSMGGGEGGVAVDVARRSLAGLIAALPASALAEGTRGALDQTVAALPQGRGRLSLRLEVPDGIGAARLAVAALSRDPFGPEAMARLFAGASIAADWQAGLAP
jgi:hypothetical protein